MESYIDNFEGEEESIWNEQDRKEQTKVVMQK